MSVLTFSTAPWVVTGVIFSFMDEKDVNKIEEFVSFLNHRAIHFRKMGNYEKSLGDLNVAISLDPKKEYYDIYFNLTQLNYSIPAFFMPNHRKDTQDAKNNRRSYKKQQVNLCDFAVIFL